MTGINYFEEYPFRFLKLFSLSKRSLTNGTTKEEIIDELEFYMPSSLKQDDLLKVDFFSTKESRYKKSNFAFAIFLHYQLIKKRIDDNERILEEHLKNLTYPNDNNSKITSDFEIDRQSDNDKFFRFWNKYLDFLIERNKSVIEERNILQEFDKKNFIQEFSSNLLRNYSLLHRKIHKDREEAYLQIYKLTAFKYKELFTWILSEYSNIISTSTKTKMERVVIGNFGKLKYNLRTNINDFQFSRIVTELKKYEYIDKGTTRHQIINIFSQNSSKHDYINWVNSRGSLYTFIKYLKDKNIILNDNPFEIAANNFTINNVAITTKQLRDSKISQNTYTRNILSRICSMFLNPTLS